MESLVQALFPDPRRAVEKQLKRDGKVEEWVVFESVDAQAASRMRLPQNMEATLSTSASKVIGDSEQGLQIKWTSAAEIKRREQAAQVSNPSLSDMSSKPLPVEKPLAKKPNSRLPTRIGPESPLTFQRDTDKADHPYHDNVEISCETTTSSLKPPRVEIPIAPPACLNGSSSEADVHLTTSDPGSLLDLAAPINSTEPPVQKEKPSLLRSFSLRSKSRPSSPTNTANNAAIPELPKSNQRPKSPKSPKTSIDHNLNNLNSAITHRRIDTTTPELASDKPSKRPIPLDLPLPPLRRSTSHSPPSAPLPPITLRLDPKLPGGEHAPTLVSAIGTGEKERKRGFLKGLIGRKKQVDVPPVPILPPLPFVTPVPNDSRPLLSEQVAAKPVTHKASGPVAELKRVRSNATSRADSETSSFDQISDEDTRSVRNVQNGRLSERGHSAEEARTVDVQAVVEGVLNDLGHPPIDLQDEINRRKASLGRSGKLDAPRFRLPEKGSEQRLNPIEASGADNMEGSLSDTDIAQRKAARMGEDANDEHTLIAEAVNDAASVVNDDDLTSIVSESSTSSPPLTPSTPITPAPTTFLGQTFEGLPFGPDVPAVSMTAASGADISSF